MMLKGIPPPGSIQEAQPGETLHGYSSKHCDGTLISVGVWHSGYLSGVPQNRCDQTSLPGNALRIETVVMWKL